MKHPPFTLSSLAPSTDVLEAFLALGRKMKPDLAMIECRNITERMVLARVQDLIEPQIRETYETQIAMFGDPAKLKAEDQTEFDEFTDSVDEAIEALFEQYRPSITLDFMGRYTIDTRLHQSVASGPDEVTLLAAAFAKDALRVLIHDSDEDSDTHVLTTAKILSAVGIVKDDLIEILGDMPEPTPAQQAKTMKDLKMKSMNDIFNELHAFWGGEYDDKQMRDLFEMAIDRDDILSNSGLVPMGLDMDAAPTLRMFAAKYGAEAVNHFLAGLDGAPYEEDPTGSAPDKVLDDPGEPPHPVFDANELDEETDPEMREMMGLPPLAPANVAGGVMSLAPGTYPGKLVPASTGPALPPLGSSPGLGGHGLPPQGPDGTLAGILNRPPGVPAPALPKHVTGTIDKRALELIRKHVKRKDEDIAAGIGVSRQTYINYADPAKKATLVASDAQAAYLVNVVAEELSGLREAAKLLGVSL